MVVKDSAKGPDGLMYPPWDSQLGPEPADYPKRSRATRMATPPQRASKESSLDHHMSKLEKERQSFELFRNWAGAGARPRNRRWMTAATRNLLLQLCAVGVVVVGLCDKHGKLSLLSTTLGATITVVDASADAAEEVRQAGVNATVAATVVFVEALSVSIGIAEDAWKGVDLHNVRGSRRVGNLLTAGLLLLRSGFMCSGPDSWAQWPVRSQCQ